MHVHARRLSLLLLTPLLATCTPAAQPPSTTFTPPSTPNAAFEKQAQIYEAADRQSPPPKDAILLVGDSQFFRWKNFQQDLAPYTVINRGIDSFTTADLLHFAPRLIAPYHARVIVLHVGGNDIHNGKSPQQLLANFQSLVAFIRQTQPTTPIIFSSLTPGPARIDEAPQRIAANELLRQYITTQKNLVFLDLWHAMLQPNGEPRQDIWNADRIHPNDQGYQIRVTLMHPLLQSLLANE